MIGPRKLMVGNRPQCCYATAYIIKYLTVDQLAVYKKLIVLGLVIS